ncbi:hypothetical protein TSOC_014753, partial [Tetrabaena socialis]
MSLLTYIVMCTLAVLALVGVVSFLVIMSHSTGREGLTVEHNTPITPHTPHTIQEVPKVLWTYWEDVVMPPVVRFAIDSWKRWNPSWTIHVITNKTIGLYVDVTTFRHADSLQRLSDYVRLNVLAEHGGVWSDASIIMTQSLDWMLRDMDASRCTFFGYYLDGFTTDMRYPILESWFFACTPRNPFVHQWRDAFMLLNEFDSVEAYIAHVRATTDLQNLSIPEYLTIHVAAQLAMQHRI